MAKRRWLAGALAGFVIAAHAAAGEPALPQPGDACPKDAGCAVATGSYRIVLPPQADRERPLGAIMYFHGYQGSAEETIADPGLLAVARRLGVALIAPDGAGHTWSYPGSPARNRDEFAFVGQVLDDVAARFPVDPRRILASGFSQGGSMVWYLACRMPARFSAFAPIAGAFWEPLPERCDGQRPPLIHVHGTSDMTVPLAGRVLRSGARQGDVFRSFAILAPGGCTAAWAEAARTVSQSKELACRIASGCGGSARLELCFHAGGHWADPAWVERAWRLTMPAGPPIAARQGGLTSP
jgi:polyhydroxybutyrate depolymerase